MNEKEEKNVQTVSSSSPKKYRRFDLIALLSCLVIAASIWLYV